MFRTRVWMGTLLAALALGFLLLDGFFAPWYPFLFCVLSLVGHLGCWELRRLIPEERRPPALPGHLGLQAMIAANWLRPLNEVAPESARWAEPWPAILGVLTALFLLAFLWEMAVFDR